MSSNRIRKQHIRIICIIFAVMILTFAMFSAKNCYHKYARHHQRTECTVCFVLDAINNIVKSAVTPAISVMGFAVMIVSLRLFQYNQEFKAATTLQSLAVRLDN